MDGKFFDYFVLLNIGFRREDRIFIIIKLLKYVRWLGILCYIFKVVDRVER